MSKTNGAASRPLIPDAALDKHVALLGMTGAGKSSVIKSAIVEPDLAADRRVLIITPKDDWWGLRLSKSGKSKGYDIPIFGGWHGDYPLLVKDAALLAETYGTMKGSAIFCTSRLSGQDRARWFAAFAEALLTKNRGWVRVVIDEAHVFMPKQGGKGGGAIPAALHAGNELVSQGRSPGIRIVLASQRSAKLHNDSLTQCSCLIAMMLMAPHDRDAVKDWIADQADPEKGKEIISSLATLNTAEAWVWAPAAKMMERIQFPWPKTFDSSKAADDDAGGGPTLSPINLDALKGKLATIEAESKANDPKALRAEITALKAEAKKAPAVDPKAVEEAEKRGFDQAQKKAMAAAEAEVQKRVTEFITGLSGHIESLAGYLKENGKALKEKPLLAIEFAAAPAAAPTTRPSASVFPKPTSQVKRNTENGDGASNSEQRVLDSIRWWNVLGIAAPSHAQTAFIAGYSHKSGTWATYLSRLRSKGLIEGRGDLVLTTDGEALAADPGAPPSREALHAAVMDKIDAPLQRILSPLLNAYPYALSHAEAATMAGYSHQSGTWATYLSRLRSLDLIAGRGELKAESWLFSA